MPGSVISNRSSSNDGGDSCAFARVADEHVHRGDPRNDSTGHRALASLGDPRRTTARPAPSPALPQVTGKNWRRLSPWRGLSSRLIPAISFRAAPARPGGRCAGHAWTCPADDGWCGRSQRGKRGESSVRVELLASHRCRHLVERPVGSRVVVEASDVERHAGGVRIEDQVVEQFVFLAGPVAADRHQPLQVVVASSLRSLTSCP